MNMGRKIIAISIFITFIILIIIISSTFIFLYSKRNTSNNLEIKGLIVESDPEIPLPQCNISIKCYNEDKGLINTFTTKTNENGEFHYSISYDYLNREKIEHININAWDEFHSNVNFFTKDQLENPVKILQYPKGKIQGRIDVDVSEIENFSLCLDRPGSDMMIFPLELERDGSFITPLLNTGDYDLILSSSIYNVSEKVKITVDKNSIAKKDFKPSLIIGDIIAHVNISGKAIDIEYLPADFFIRIQEEETFIGCVYVNYTNQASFAFPATGNYTISVRYHDGEGSFFGEEKIVVLDGINHFNLPIDYCFLP